MFNQTDSVETIKNSFQSFTKKFPADIQCSDVLLDECLHFKELMKIEKKLFTSVENSVTFTMSSYIKSKELDDVFPNLNTVLRMFLSTAVPNCVGER
ncbi:zinc finger MYM-type protein 1-like [Aphis craccivora]|uniref:Zinc finger MYM-type protein 1-like n=1 Tax=Aphis craccivora TaxID=307492 RepID=A0A6G0YSR1_APHCR|nr:zinc finger MYM-type protein 1-like [Aphis craccivora]